MTDAWKSGRIVLGASILALAVFGPLGDADGETPIQVTSASTPDMVARTFALDGAVGAVYSDSVAPSPALATLLAGAAARKAPVRLPVPGAMPEIVVTPPAAAVAMRRAPLGIDVRGAPGTDLPVTIEGPAGRVDSVTVRLGPDGRGAVAVAVEPASEGEASWTVRAGGAVAIGTTWVRPAASVRVLVLTGAPGWEARYLVRALEAAGADVAVHQVLGRDQIVASSGAVVPGRMADLMAWDVVALVDPPSATPGPLLLEWMLQEGGGLLLLGTGAFGTALAPWSPAGTPREVTGSSLVWTGPAEIVPLPAAEIVSRAIPAGGAGRAPVAVAERTHVVASADWVGRGRLFTSGLESWRWAMEAGLTTEHQTYWESVVEWLAGGLTADYSLTGRAGTPMVAWEGRLEGVLPSTIALGRPGGPAESLVVARAVASGRVRFVPLTTGAHTLGDRHDGTGIGADANPLAWTAAALEIGGMGGDIRARASDDARTGRPLRSPATRLWLLFLVLGGVAVANWATRRASGLA